MSTSNFLVLHDKYLQELPSLGLIKDYNTFHVFEVFFFQNLTKYFVSLSVFREVLTDTGCFFLTVPPKFQC